MGTWERSWSITKTSFSVLTLDKEMLLFPILSGFFSLLFSAALLVPTVLIHLFEAAGGSRLVMGPAQIAALFGTYFGLAFIATFFNVCLVYTTRIRLEGGDATFMDSVRFALSRVHLIAAWALVSASVGIILHALESAAQRSGLIGKILLSILRAVLSGAWAVMTVFVVPSMVYRDLGPIDAVRDSFETLKRTWGESIIGYYGVGIASFVCTLPGILLIVGGAVLCGTSVAAGAGLIALGILAIAAALLTFSVLSSIYRTALYHFASTGTPPSGFERGQLMGAFR
ncbi:MAG TPA: DUF6159 family protein [Polyangiaceae bacterium]|jgi:hypothetical protein